MLTLSKMWQKLFNVLFKEALLICLFRKISILSFFKWEFIELFSFGWVAWIAWVASIVVSFQTWRHFLFPLEPMTSVSELKLYRQRTLLSIETLEMAMSDLQADLHSNPTNLEEFSIKFQTVLLFCIIHIAILHSFAPLG